MWCVWQEEGPNTQGLHAGLDIAGLTLAGSAVVRVQEEAVEAGIQACAKQLPSAPQCYLQQARLWERQ
jgi:hypothetical protein